MTLKQYIVSQIFQKIVPMWSGGFKVYMPSEKTLLCKTIKSKLREWFDLSKISTEYVWIIFEINPASPKKVFDAQFGVFITFQKDIQGRHGMFIDYNTLEVIPWD